MTVGSFDMAALESAWFIASPTALNQLKEVLGGESCWGVVLMGTHKDYINPLLD